MLSFRRFTYVLLIVLGICGIFILYNVNENNDRSVTISNPKVEEKELLLSDTPLDKGSQIQFYAIGYEEKETYGAIYENVCQLLSDWKVSYKKVHTLSESELEDGENVLIFCDDIISDHVDLKQLASFIERGGRAVLAAGIAEGYQDSYLLPVLGIAEKTIKENYCRLRFAKNFLLLQDDVMVYDGFMASSWIAVRDGADIYVEEQEKGAPIVYSYPYGKGKTLIINATMLSDDHCMGILAAGLGSLLDELIYPVLGTECVFLDNFPIVTYVNDTACMKLYGRTTETFVRDSVWPVFQGMALRNEIKYTSSVLCVAKEGYMFPENSESPLYTLGKSVLQYSGELAYAAENEDGYKLFRNDDFISHFKDTFQNYDVRSLVLITDQPAEEAIDTLGEDIRSVRGKWDTKEADKKMACLEHYDVFPEATRGNDLENGNMMAVSSILTSHGMVSHTFDVNCLVSDDRKQNGWDKSKIRLGQFERKIFRKTDYLQKLTISETHNALKSYLQMDYAWKRTGKIIEIWADRMVEGQSFLLRTDQRIIDSEGADYEKVSDNYYFVRLYQTKAELTFQ